MMEFNSSKDSGGGANVSSLPVPDICEELEYSFKQNKKNIQPPKLRPRNCANCSCSVSMSSAHAITIIKDDYDNVGNSSATMELPLSQSYNPDLNQTYFDQCFQALEMLGEGSFGTVFKVRSKDDGNLYALKVSKQLHRGDNYRSQRLEEVRRYLQFSGHENCVKFYHAWEQNDTLYMQMELCRESLESYMMKRTNISEEKIWSILLDLLLALKSLHDRNLIHLDIKLENILIANDNSCKLADFGLVIDIDKANAHQTTEGDSRYMAPEIMEGIFSKAADVFSLGIAMLEMACYLELPSNGPLWQQLRQGKFPECFDNAVSKVLQEVIRGMMTPDPAARPTVDELLKHHKLVRKLVIRKRWKICDKFKHYFHKYRKKILSNLYVFRRMIYGTLNFVASTKRLRYFRRYRAFKAINDSKIHRVRRLDRHVIPTTQATPTTMDAITLTPPSLTSFVTRTPPSATNNFTARTPPTPSSTTAAAAASFATTPLSAIKMIRRPASRAILSTSTPKGSKTESRVGFATVTSTSTDNEITNGNGHGHIARSMLNSPIQHSSYHHNSIAARNLQLYSSSSNMCNNSLLNNAAYDDNDDGVDVGQFVDINDSDTDHFMSSTSSLQLNLNSRLQNDSNNTSGNTSLNYNTSGIQNSSHSLLEIKSNQKRTGNISRKKLFLED